MDNIDLEREFGIGFREKMKQAAIAEFAGDEETKELFEDVCAEINESSINDEELVKMLTNFPANIGLTIARSVQRDNVKLAKMLYELYYFEYLQKTQEAGRNGKTAFDKRYEWKKTDDGEKFLTERLLTLVELDSLIRAEGVKSGEQTAKHQYANVEYLGENYRIKRLLEIRKIVSKTEFVRKTREMTDKVKKHLLTNLLGDLKKMKTNVEV